MRSRRWERQSVQSFTLIEKRCGSGGTSITASSSSGTLDNGDESLANKSGDTETLTADSGGGRRREGDEGASISTSKLVARSLLSEGKCMRQFHFVLHRSCYWIDRNVNRDATRRSRSGRCCGGSGLTFGVDDDGSPAHYHFLVSYARPGFKGRPRGWR